MVPKGHAPMLPADYGFISDPGGVLVAILVVSIAPPVLFAAVVDGEGSLPIVVRQMATWIHECGLVHFVYRTDKEAAICDLIRDAVRESGRPGRPREPDHDPEDEPACRRLSETQPETPSMDPTVLAVPEHSHPGESQSNGRVERAVQLVEDQSRTLRAALQAHLGTEIPCTHPLVRWMVGHAARTLTKYKEGDDGRTPYTRVHGKRTLERIAEVGEKILW